MGSAFLPILVGLAVRGVRGSVLAPGSSRAPAFRAPLIFWLPVAVGGVCSPVTVAGPLRIRTGFLAAARRMELSVPATLRSVTTARQAL